MADKKTDDKRAAKLKEASVVNRLVAVGFSGAQIDALREIFKEA